MPSADYSRPILPAPYPNNYCFVIVTINYYQYYKRRSDGVETPEYEYLSSGAFTPGSPGRENEGFLAVQREWIPPSQAPYGVFLEIYPRSTGIWGYNSTLRLDLFNRISNSSNPDNGIYQPANMVWGLQGQEADIYAFLDNSIYYDGSIGGGSIFDIRVKRTYKIIYSSCRPSITPTPLPTYAIYLGTAAPPPPPPKNMDCCTCNDIATIVEAKNYDQLLALQKLFEDIKDHIDKRALEVILKDLEHLRALDFEEFLKAVIKRINEVESNLWNGPKQ